MASSVFFKFKSQKDPQRVEFDGTAISVYDLKHNIIVKAGLGEGSDFDLAIYDEDSIEYKDDNVMIPRSTSVTARRLPPKAPGKGNAARYTKDKMPPSKNHSRKEAIIKAAAAKTKSGPVADLSSLVNENMTEEQKMEAMFQAQDQAWSVQKAEMANQTKVIFNKNGAQAAAQGKIPDHEPPPGYICYRCNMKGHWIQACPTNEDPNFDNKPKVKRTTGIPRSFLKAVEKPVAVVNDGTVDDSKGPQGVMMNAEGEAVIWEPDAKAWQKFQAKTKTAPAVLEAAALESKEIQERGLECPLDKRPFLDPMKTPCCEKTYCNDCITNALIDSDFICPGCQTEGVLIDDLIPDDEMRKKGDDYIAEKEAAKVEKARSKSPSIKPESPAAVVSKPASPVPKLPTQNSAEKAKSTSPTPETSSAPSQGKKRPAEDALQNDPKIPKGPKAMQQQEAKKALLAQQNMNPMMNGMPNMGFPMMMNGFNNFGGMPMPMPMMPMPNFGMGMPNPTMNPMYNNFNGFPNMNGMNGMNFNPGFNPMMNNMGAMGRGGPMGGNMNMNGNAGAGAAGGFQNQQKTVFAEPLPSEEGDAYFRKPVNPHRHQGRQRRARPSDFREV